MEGSTLWLKVGKRRAPVSQEVQGFRLMAIVPNFNGRVPFDTEDTRAPSSAKQYIVAEQEYNTEPKGPDFAIFAAQLISEYGASIIEFAPKDEYSLTESQMRRYARMVSARARVQARAKA